MDSIQTGLQLAFGDPSPACNNDPLFDGRMNTIEKAKLGSIRNMSRASHTNVSSDAPEQKSTDPPGDLRPSEVAHSKDIGVAFTIDARWQGKHPYNLSEHDSLALDRATPQGFQYARDLQSELAFIVPERQERTSPGKDFVIRKKGSAAVPIVKIAKETKRIPQRPPEKSGAAKQRTIKPDQELNLGKNLSKPDPDRTPPEMSVARSPASEVNTAGNVNLYLPTPTTKQQRFTASPYQAQEAYNIYANWEAGYQQTLPYAARQYNPYMYSPYQEYYQSDMYQACYNQNTASNDQ